MPVQQEGHHVASSVVFRASANIRDFQYAGRVERDGSVLRGIGAEDGRQSFFDWGATEG